MFWGISANAIQPVVALAILKLKIALMGITAGMVIRRGLPPQFVWLTVVMEVAARLFVAQAPPVFLPELVLGVLAPVRMVLFVCGPDMAITVQRVFTTMKKLGIPVLTLVKVWMSVMLRGRETYIGNLTRLRLRLKKGKLYKSASKPVITIMVTTLRLTPIVMAGGGIMTFVRQEYL
jgi:hypothetical protein